MTAFVDQPRIRDFDDPGFNPFLADELMIGDDLDPYPRIDRWRSEGAVHAMDYRVAMGLHPDVTTAHLKQFTVFGYDAVMEVFNDPATYGNAAYGFNLGISFGKSISTMDAPEHTRYRRIFQKAFLPSVLAEWGDRVVASVVDDLISSFAGDGRADLVRQFTLQYPFQVIYRQLALPGEDVEVFHKLAIAQTLASVDPVHGHEAGLKLGEYFSAMVSRRRNDPGTDLVSLLATAEVDGERLPEEVVISFLRQLINAGGDTTYRATSVLLTGLLGDPDQLEAVRVDRSLVPAAVEEALRWDGPVLFAQRMTTKDAVLAGVDVPAGAVIGVLSGSANRDPSRFARPDRFDIRRTRGANRHFAFATGPHVCIGQHLARLEMGRALNALLDRLPGLRLDPDMPPPQIRGAMMRVPKSLNVRFDPSSPDRA